MITHNTPPLPCPFCGAAPTWRHTGIPAGRVRTWRSSLQCDDCQLPRTTGTGIVYFEGGNALAHQEAMREAITRWNRRPTPVCKPTAVVLHDEFDRLFFYANVTPAPDSPSWNSNRPWTALYTLGQLRGTE